MSSCDVPTSQIFVDCLPAREISNCKHVALKRTIIEHILYGNCTRLELITRRKCNFVYHKYFKRHTSRYIEVVRSVIMNTFNKYGMHKVFNHRKHENTRICLIFKIITKQPRRNRKPPNLDGKPQHWLSGERLRIFTCATRRCADVLRIGTDTTTLVSI